MITEHTLDIRTAFDKKYDNSSGFDYMLERTFYRPRDVISYVNHLIESSVNKSYFSYDIIKKAEIGYSVDRIQAIEDEWGENYGEINHLFKWLYGKYNGFNLKNVKEDEFASILFGENTKQIFKGELLEIIIKWQKDKIGFSEFLKNIVILLFNFGVIRIKKGPTVPVLFFYDADSTLIINDINDECKIYIHKAFYSSLKINTKELEQNQF